MLRHLVRVGRANWYRPVDSAQLGTDDSIEAKMTNDPDNMRSPLSRVRGLGTAHDGTHHWIAQRLSAVALIPLSIWFVVTAITIVRAGAPEAMTILQSPFHAIMLMTLLVMMLYHGMLGMQVIIEDYVHTRSLRVISLLLLRGITWVTGIASLCAVVTAHIAAHIFI
jgi:succinate dehydrogenase / fumarate reductase membrane anchor subunit